MYRPARHGRALGAALLFAVACNAEPKDSALLSLTADHFKATATVTADAGGATLTVSTQPGFVQRSGPLRTVWNDEYLTAVIDRSTGRASYQVSVLIVYGGRFRSYDSAQYAAAAGAQTVQTTAQLRQAENCAVGDCTYTERVAFPVDEDVLRQRVAADAGAPSLWHFTLLAKYGPVYQGALSSAEIAGLLARVAVLAAPPEPQALSSPGPLATGPAAPATVALQAAPVHAPPAAALHDLGIDGLAVADGGEQPNRAGVLVAAVKSGSVAQTAGVIVGDIIYEFDGHATLNIAALQAAVSAGAASASVPFKLFRGTTRMTMTAHF